ncbi:uncharacterized protein BX664DRAFT_388095 [Halteromyces radiatus]|uniref:uncharacterized protein n=1 Tax=Halteromyces radiatus TaxID=101107 RepID=UPI0022209461|nr:uncharacterized protein BX664DRAFT_388095 [Halteromyces radiatus]KAI8082977.1 hypothetical protein BX664DRAFT_388095 [Halteromyces radiatus]
MLSSCQRKKSIKPHVRTACVNCKKAHLACDAERPCKRCISVGKTDSCYDIQHKKRGRPKLREKYASNLESDHHMSTSLSTKRQVPRHQHHTTQFQPMLPLSLPSQQQQQISPLLARHSSSSPIDSLTPFLTMSSPPSSFMMTKSSTTSSSPFNLSAMTNVPMMTIFLTPEMCCARASDETMDFLGYHPQELAHRSLYDFISNTSELHHVHQLLSQSYQQSLHSQPSTVSTNSNDDYYHQLPPTTLLNIANGSKTFKMVLYFYTADQKGQIALDARFYFGGGLGADLCRSSTLHHLYIVCLLTKSTTNILPTSSKPVLSSSVNAIPSPISPPLLDLLTDQTIHPDFSSLSYLSSSLSSISSSSSSSSSASSSTQQHISASSPLQSLLLTPPYSNLQTPVDQEETSLYSWLDFAFSSNAPSIK